MLLSISETNITVSFEEITKSESNGIISYIVNLSTSIKSMITIIKIDRNPSDIIKSILYNISILHKLQTEILNKQDFIISPAVIVLCYEVNNEFIKSLDFIYGLSDDEEKENYLQLIKVLNPRWVKETTRRIGAFNDEYNK